MARTTAPILLATWLVACGPKTPDAIEDVEITELPMPTAVEIAWSSPSPGESFVEYGLDGAFDRTRAASSDGTEHTARLVLLKGAKTYQARAVTVIEGGERVESEPVTIEVAPPPQSMGRLTMNVIDGDRAEVLGGYVLTTLIGAGPSFVGIVDGDGDWVWWAKMDAPDLSSARARLGLDGASVLYNLYQTDRGDDQGWVVRVSLDGTEVVHTRTLLAHHDFVELPDGQIAWLGYDQRDVEVDGVDTRDQGPGPHPVATDVILEGPEGMADGEAPDELWNVFEDYPAAPYWGCGHTEIKGVFVPGYYDWTHGNSLAYVPGNDSYYVLSRYLDALIRVDRASGGTEWVLGGDHGEFTWTGTPFQHGHVSDVWEDGMLIFDNRDHDGPTRIAEIAWDEDQRTAEVVWEFPRPDGAILPVLGDARRLPGGNRLIAWSSRGEMAEVSPQGEVLLQASLGLGTILTRVVYFTEDDLDLE